MITGGFSYLAVIVFFAGAVAWAERRGASAFFRYLPAVVLIYLGTMLLATASLWEKTGEISTCYRVAKTHLLPLLIYLMLLRCDLRSILRLGPRMLVGFFTASLSIVLGFVAVFAALKGLYEPDTWKSFAALSGSWIGGTGNMVAVQEALDLPASRMGYVLLMDSVNYAFWVMLLLALTSLAPRFNGWTGSDTSVLQRIGTQLSRSDGKSRAAGDATDLMLLLGTGLLVSALCMYLAGKMPTTDFITVPAWTVILVTLIGIIAAMTPLARLPGSAQLSSVALYILIGLIGSMADFTGLTRAPLYIASGFLIIGVHAAITVPTDVQNPGTQPGQVFGLESPDKCDNCHGGYDRSHESAYAWRGSVMSQATRDPIFWATMAVAEQDFDGVGDYCLRCHTPAGWLGGRTTPTDGSGLAAGDADGVCCDTCHKLTNPDDSEFVGVQLAPYVANDEEAAPTGYYGSGMFVMWGRPEKMGPYADSTSKHRSCRSVFQRQSEICGTCHDVSNPAVGDLAPGNGAQVPLEPGTFSGVPGSPVETKAAFRNFPFQYGIVERTFSEHKASLLAATRVADYPGLPAELHAGAIEATYESALVAGQGGDYEDGTPRSFTCQGCHLRPVTGRGCNKGSELRQDLPLHDLTGGNDWVPDAILWLDARGLLRIGGGLTATQKAALLDGKARAQKRLSEAASLTVTGNTLRVVNLTGHKLISGYPEGRRMWLNVKWYDASWSHWAARLDLPAQPRLRHVDHERILAVFAAQVVHVARSKTGTGQTHRGAKSHYTCT